MLRSSVEVQTGKTIIKLDVAAGGILIANQKADF